MDIKINIPIKKSEFKSILAKPVRNTLYDLKALLKSNKTFLAITHVLDPEDFVLFSRVAGRLGSKVGGEISSGAASTGAKVSSGAQRVGKEIVSPQTDKVVNIVKNKSSSSTGEEVVDESAAEAGDAARRIITAGVLNFPLE